MNRNFYNLFMDYSGLRKEGICPCDIDMIYYCPDNYVIIGEAKLKGSHLKGVQERVLTGMIDGHRHGGVLMEIEHTSRVQDGADSVDIAGCAVRRAYFDGQWHEYPNPLSVLAWMRGLKDKHGADQ